MCTNPLTITRNYPLIGTKQYIIPCGKCAECVKKKQAEFSALAVHQALHSGSLYMFTLTYNDNSLPIAISESTSDGPRVVGFQRGAAAIMLSSDSHFMNRVISVSADNPSSESFSNAASLHREDVKLVLKHFRQLCKERNLPLVSFKYAFFGEYGELHGRPHYHGLMFGLSPEQVDLFKKLWSDRFGFVHCGPVPGTSVSLDDILAMTQYASKYISKGVYSFWKFLLPYVEKPRRQSSLNFGDFSPSEIEELISFMMGATSLNHPDFLELSSWILSRLDAHLFPLLAGNIPSLKD